MALRGIFDKPYFRFDDLVSAEDLAAIHEEVCLALAQIPTSYTGGSHRSMGIVPPSRLGECHGDYGEVIAAMSPRQRATFATLADEPPPPNAPAADFGEERRLPLSRRQMLWLEKRFGVYFPWTTYVELIPNLRWEDKADSAGKDFTRVAKTFFPKTIEVVRGLPFERIGRCNVLGLGAHQYGTVHRDGEPEDQVSPDHFLTLYPSASKRLFLWDEDTQTKTPVTGPVVWFNDFDYHGVDADPFFRYSIRVDGVFQKSFLAAIVGGAA
jgi:hypothetical protein